MAPLTVLKLRIHFSYNSTQFSQKCLGSLIYSLLSLPYQTEEASNSESACGGLFVVSVTPSGHGQPERQVRIKELK